MNTSLHITIYFNHFVLSIIVLFHINVYIMQLQSRHVHQVSDGINQIMYYQL